MRMVFQVLLHRGLCYSLLDIVRRRRADLINNVMSTLKITLVTTLTIMRRGYTYKPIQKHTYEYARKCASNVTTTYRTHFSWLGPSLQEVLKWHVARLCTHH